MADDPITEKEESQETEAQKKNGKVEDELDVLEPKGAARVQVLGLGDEEREYTQRPLSYFGKLEMFSVLGNAIDRGMQEGLMFNNILGALPSAGGGVSAEAFIQAAGKLAAYAPDLLLDLYCIWLAVPREERWDAKRLMSLSEEEGGLSDEEGIDIIAVFIDQNAEVLKDFFAQRIKPLIGRARERFGLEQPSPKPSKRTRRRTQKPSKTS